MSMSDYAIHEPAALFISHYVAAVINSINWTFETDDRPIPDCLSQEEFEDEDMFGDVSEAVERLEAAGCKGLCCVNKFTGEIHPIVRREYGKHINDDAHAAYEASLKKTYDKVAICNDDFIAYIRADREGSLFAPAYANIDELIAEFKSKLAAIGYDISDLEGMSDEQIRDNIVEISGTHLEKPRKYCVSVTRRGCVWVEATSPEEAMAIAERQPDTIDWGNAVAVGAYVGTENNNEEDYEEDDDSYSYFD